MPNISRTALETRGGRAADFARLDQLKIDIRDIAASLSKLCRYNGHTREFYSVAEHCVILAEYARRNYSADAAMHMLLHDAAEAYIGDYPLPMKRLFTMLEVMEFRVDELIAFKFGLQHPFPDYVKDLDRRVVIDEKRVLYPDSRWTWPSELDGLEPLGVEDRIAGFPPATAEAQYLDAFNILLEERAVR